MARQSEQYWNASRNQRASPLEHSARPRFSRAGAAAVTLKNEGHTGREGGAPSARQRTQTKNSKSCCTSLADRYHSFGKTLLWYLLFLVGTAGLIWQLGDITSLYFQFQTVTELEVEIPTAILAPAISVCGPYMELADKAQLIKKLPQLANLTRPYRLSDLSQLTIKDIYEVTPNIENIDFGFLYSCYYRKPKSYSRMYKYSKKKTDNFCMQVFIIEKYFKQQYVCYAISMINATELEFSFSYLMNSLRNPGMFFDVSMDLSKWVNVTALRMIVHPADKKPRGSKAFPVTVIRSPVTLQFKDGPVPIVDLTSYLSYSVFVNNLLAKPYASDCFDYGTVAYESKEHCIDDCVSKDIVAAKGKVPFSVVTTDMNQTDKPIVSMEDLSDDSFRTMMYDVEQRCKWRCRQPNCVEEIYVTNFIRMEGTSDLDEADLKFRLYAANRPTIITSFKPRLQIVEFLVYLLSCFGIWYGLSFYSFMGIIQSAAKLIKEEATN